jgi:hypothetical protein
MDIPRLERTKVTLFRVTDDDEDVDYWLAQSPATRLHALETNRRIAYGYDDTLGFQNVFEITRNQKG